jgi:hypothetical protein
MSDWDVEKTEPLGEWDVVSQEPEAPAPQQAAPRSLGDDLGRQVGLTARAGVTGALAAPNTAADGINHIINLGIDAFNEQSGANIPRLSPSSEAMQRILSAFGLPVAETPAEKVVQSGVSGMAGAATGIGLGNAIGGAAGAALSAAPVTQIAGGLTGGAASEAAAQSGAGPIGQLAAGAVGSLAPSAVRVAGAAATRGAVRGKDPTAMRENIRTFEDAGTEPVITGKPEFGKETNIVITPPDSTPTVGQAAGNRRMRATDSLLSKIPGSAGPYAKKAQAQAADVGDNVKQMADFIAPGADATSAGRSIQKGIETGFVPNFKAQSSTHYDKLDTFIPRHKRVDVTATRQALESLNAPIPGAPNLSVWFRNSKIKGIERGLKGDTEGLKGVYSQLPAWEKAHLDALPAVQRNTLLASLVDGKLPYEALKKLRTLVGDQLTNHSLVDDVPKSKWKALYAAISKDMGIAAEQAGPDAVKAFGRANKYHSAGIDRIEVLERTVDKLDFESIFKSAMSGTAEGAALGRQRRAIRIMLEMCSRSLRS